MTTEATLTLVPLVYPFHDGLQADTPNTDYIQILMTVTRCHKTPTKFIRLDIPSLNQKGEAQVPLRFDWDRHYEQLTKPVDSLLHHMLQYWTARVGNHRIHYVPTRDTVKRQFRTIRDPRTTTVKGGESTDPKNYMMEDAGGGPQYRLDLLFDDCETIVLLPSLVFLIHSWPASRSRWFHTQRV